MNRLFIVVLALTLAGCASVIEGSSQEITINTNPSAANCAINRQNETIARVDPTPGGAMIKKTKYDITIVCNKDGYQEATYLDKSGIEGSTWGNIILGGGIGWAVDSASGSDNHYESPVNVTLVPVSARQPTASQSAPAAQSPPAKPAS